MPQWFPGRWDEGSGRSEIAHVSRSEKRDRVRIIIQETARGFEVTITEAKRCFTYDMEDGELRRHPPAASDFWEYRWKYKPSEGSGQFDDAGDSATGQLDSAGVDTEAIQ